MPAPSFKIARLREIGWQEWDPIGLAPPEPACEDEYDTYLLKVAEMLWQETSRSVAVDYLVRVEWDYMGLGPRRSSTPRAQATVDAICAYLAELRGC